jgi:hypothetical protein
MRSVALAAAAVVALAVPPPSRAQDAADVAWSAKKCAIYDNAWQAALRMQGPTGIGEAFTSRNAAFVASGCLGDRNVCPRSAEELAFADLLTIMVVSEGIAGTFLPFGCPQ